MNRAMPAPVARVRRLVITTSCGAGCSTNAAMTEMLSNGAATAANPSAVRETVRFHDEMRPHVPLRRTSGDKLVALMGVLSSQF